MTRGHPAVMAIDQTVSSEMKRRAASVRRNSLAAGIASRSEVQPGASTRSPWKLQSAPRPACRLKPDWGDHIGDEEAHPWKSGSALGLQPHVGKNNLRNRNDPRNPSNEGKRDRKRVVGDTVCDSLMKGGSESYNPEQSTSFAQTHFNNRHMKCANSELYQTERCIWK